ncbi:MAG: 50S ribosomal protein L9 [Planctomycetota bacterium]
MARTVKLLLTENVDNLGIVGDVVNVRMGYARNFLLPRDLATVPSDDMIRDLAEKRKQAEAELAQLREKRKALIDKIEGIEITMTRACNDQGQLYGSVSQHDISAALTELGYEVAPREVRLPHAIKRVDHYDVLVKFDSELEAEIKVWVEADRQLDNEREDEMEFDNEGNLIEKPAAKEAEKAEPAAAE